MQKSQDKASTWERHEEECADKTSIFRKFEVLHLDSEGTRGVFRQGREYENQKRKLVYLLTRQEFISPSFFPVFQENFLRDDFDFAHYLSLGLADTLSSVLTLGDQTYLTLGTLFLLFSWASQYLYFTLYFTLLYCLPLLSLAALLALEHLHHDILFDLTHHIQSPYDFSFTQFERDRDPYSNIDKLLPPRFLAVPLRPLLFTPLASKHRRLFLFACPSLHTYCLHALLTANTLWLIEYLFSFEYRFQENVFKFILDLVIVSCYLFQLLCLFPENLILLAQVTRLQQMRHKHSIRNVVQTQRRSVANVFVQLHRLIKSSRRTALSPPSPVRISPRQSMVQHWFRQISGNDT